MSESIHEYEPETIEQPKIDRAEFFKWFAAQKPRIRKTIRLCQEFGIDYLYLMVDPFQMQLGFWEGREIDDYWPHLLITGVDLPKSDFTEWGAADRLTNGIRDQFEETHGDHES